MAVSERNCFTEKMILKRNMKKIKHFHPDMNNTNISK